MHVLNMIVYAAITLGVLVFVHESGHFLAAKLSGMRADVFSLGFGLRLFGYNRKNGFSYGALAPDFDTGGYTDYRVSLLPLGGYVKIAGMIDESFDTEFLNRTSEPWEFRAKPIWARMFVISAGVIMNVLLAISIFWGVNYTHGRLIEETTEIGYVTVGSPADKSGLRAGDKILSINNKTVTHWDEIPNSIYLDNFGKDVTLGIERNGELKQLVIPRTLLPDNSEQGLGIIEAHTVVMIGEVEQGKPADKLGLKAGDILLSLNNVKIVNDSDVIRIVHAGANKPIDVTWKRGDQILSGTTTPTDSGRIGIRLGNYYTGPKRLIKYSLFEALIAGVNNVVQSTILFYKSIGQVIVGKASLKDNFGGPIAIAQLATKSAESGITSFLSFMALLSMSLAVLNILPFPVLDGGHLVMLVYEKILGHEISPRVKLAIQKAGFIILLAFMAFIIYNDITRF